MEVQELSRKLMDLIGMPETSDDLFEKLTAIAFTVGGMTVQFEAEDRPQVLMHLTQTLARGLMDTSHSMGEPIDMEIIVGEKSK